MYNYEHINNNPYEGKYMANFNNIHRAQFRIENLQEYLYNRDAGYTESGVAKKSAEEWRKDCEEWINRVQEELVLLDETINLIEEQYMAKTEVADKYVLKGE